ncbi:ABC transporter permease [Streptomyces sp. NPDC058274]|jgi:ABC-2 type transport system permease protein|uniref:ABC transporter permease n=1 Tax=Streptomyces sp. NPDC058274 TaxID=3346416 RepID=UPI0029CF5BD9|nr:type transport system permease protein [Streptomyces sp.]
MTTLAAPGAGPRTSPFSGVNPTFVRYELRRRFNRQTTIFTLLLPAVLYLALFRTSPAHATLPHGNFAAWMMIGLAVYGAAMAATSAAATISVERSVGWMRTIALSPLAPPGYLLVKVVCSVVMAAVPVAIVGVLGYVTGARADAEVWVTSLLVAWIGAAVFAALGIAMGLALKPEVVMHMPGLTMTALAFLGNLFIPLSGTMLDISRFTPMYGVSTLARYALTDGYSFSGEHSSLSGAVFNIVAWFAGFSFLAVRRFAKSTGRL